jgi:branched-chain amino acid transport system substrate-binding protein
MMHIFPTLRTLRTFRTLVAAACVAVAFAGCKKDSGTASTGDVIIGHYASLNGAQSDFGTSCNDGVKLAIKQANAKGGVLGKQVKLVVEDTESKTETTTAVVQKLISSDHVNAVIGEVASTRSRAGGGICQDRKIPMLSPASTNPEVTRIGDYVFRICFTDDFQGPVAAKFAASKGWKKVAVLTDSANDYSKGLSRSFKETYPKSGGSIVTEEFYPKDTRDFSTLLNKIKASNPDAVFASGYYSEMILILPQARQIGLNVPFFGGDGWDSPEILKLGGAADNCYFTNHYSPDDTRPEVVAFIKDYQAEYGRVPDAMAVLGYDAANVMLDAIKRANSSAPAAIRDALAATKDFPAVTGKITLDKDRNAHKPIVIVRIQGKDLKLEQAINPD